MIEYDARMNYWHATYTDKHGGWHERFWRTREAAEKWLAEQKRRDK